MLLLSSRTVLGEEPADVEPTVRELIQRLEKAESRIQSLQVELQQVKSHKLAPKVLPASSVGESILEQPVFSRELMPGSRQQSNIVNLVSQADPTGNDDGVSLKDILADQAEVNDELATGIKQSAQPGTGLSNMKIVGRVHADYWGFPSASAGAKEMEGGPDGPQDRIGFRRMRFGVRGDVWENMEYRIEMEFAGGNASEFRDAWLGFKNLPVLQKVLIGNQKRPYGLDHLNSSRYNVFIERPFIVESFNQDARRMGIASYGVSDDLAYNWRYGVYNQRLVQDEGNYTNDHLQLEFAARLANTIWYDECSDGRGYAHWAVSGSLAYPDGSTAANNGGTGPDVNEARFRHRPEARTASRWLDTGVIAGADKYQLLGFEGVVNVGPFQIVGEYLNTWMQRDSGSGNDLYFGGGYLQASYFLTGEHVPWQRKSGTVGRVKPFENFFWVDTCDGCSAGGMGAWQVALRWSYADLTDENIFGGVGENLTVGLNWHWNPNARMQFNYIYGDIDGRQLASGRDGGDYHIVGTRLMIDF